MATYNDVLALQDAIFDALIPDENGEIDESKLDLLLSAKDIAITEWLEKMAKIRANVIADIDGLKSEQKRIAERVQGAERNLDTIEARMLSMLKLSGQEKINAGTFKIGTRKSVSVYVQPGFNNADYMRVKTISEPDKNAIKDALKQGAVIDGAYLTEKENLAVK